MPFMKIESSPLVEESLGGIVKSGWNSIRWKRGYTLLHYCAESGEDRVVELVATFCPDIDHRDDTGFRPIDYARQSGHSGVIRVLKWLRRGKTKMQGKQSPRNTDTPAHVRRPDLEQRLEEMIAKGGQPNSLVQAIRTVLEVGWENIDWPMNFSAMHLAAQSGNLEAVELLVACNGDLTLADDCHLLPLDYAVQGNKEDVIRYIQIYIESHPVHTELSSGPNKSLSASSQPRPKEPTPEERKLFEVPQNLRPDMQRACEDIIRKGWQKIKWSHDFTALHLAARSGSVDGVTFLMKATAWPGLSREDDKGNTPLDYARDKGHADVAKLLQEASTWGTDAAPRSSDQFTKAAPAADVTEASPEAAASAKGKGKGPPPMGKGQ